MLITSLEQIPESKSWEEISRELKLSESFIAQYSDKVIWRFICSHQILSEKFIESHVDKID